MTNQPKIVLASILIVTAGLLVLNLSTITTVQAQMYDYDYGYEKHQKKSSDVNIQKIKCVNSNINVNGIDITEIPHDATTTGGLQANEQGPNGAQNGNGFGDLNINKNLLNICANVNVNEQIKLEPSDIPDTNLDLAVANFGSDDVSILLGTGTGSFDPPTLPIPATVGAGDEPFSVAVGDFNGDTFLDLAVANRADDNVSILLGNGLGGFNPANQSPVEVGDAPVYVAVGLFNGDNFLDLAVANGGGVEVSILLGNGDGTFDPKTDFGADSGPSSVAVGDFNGDNFLDLAVADANIDKVSILLGTGTGSFGAATNFNVGDGPFFVAVGLFNGDNFLDLAVANAGSDNVSILLGTGTGSFGAATNFGVGDVPASIAVGLFNGDNFLDLAVANAGDDNVSIFLGDGNGLFGAATPATVGVGDGPNSVAAGDFNGDTFLDLATANIGDGTASILLGDGNGAFNPATPPTVVVGTQPIKVVVGEFDGL